MSQVGKYIRYLIRRKKNDRVNKSLLIKKIFFFFAFYLKKEMSKTKILQYLCKL